VLAPTVYVMTGDYTLILFLVVSLIIVSHRRFRS